MQPVAFNATFTQALNFIGTFVFAISGALLAVHKNYDIVGMTVLAEITAIGGGVLRDLILGAVPPAAFTDHVSFLLPIGATALVFFTHRYMYPRENNVMHRYVNQIQYAVLIFDAAGLAVFCVAGTAKALTYGIEPIEAIALGAITAVGGGIMRDVLANDQPAILRADSELYAVPAVLGSAIIVGVQYLKLAQLSAIAASIAVLVVFAMRIAALHYGWRAPQPIPPAEKRNDP